MKKSIGFSVAAIILTALYGMLCVGIFTNTGLVYFRSGYDTYRQYRLDFDYVYHAGL